ncbi:MAG: 4'-phosphopantetheinyl transferase superfamily protein [Streptomyces sp.]|uniref:4'-phosphopantetheinyl transferase superfamily protein n=1 Tax=Streptomyces sp. TaxID=1931 RepID=UPI003D6B8030
MDSARRAGSEPCSTRERRMVDRLAGERPGLAGDRLLFSAKEAVCKAWYPAARRRIGTGAVAVAFTTGGLLTAEVRPDRTSPHPARLRPEDGGVKARYTGRWCVEGGLLLTAMAGPAGTPATAPGSCIRATALQVTTPRKVFPPPSSPRTPKASRTLRAARNRHQDLTHRRQARCPPSRLTRHGQADPVA